MYIKFFKAAFDLVASLLLLVCVFPILLFVAAMLFVVNKGDVFFYQKRIGKNNRPFDIIKFKTMLDIFGVDGVLLSDANRLTPTGRWVRDWSLDELPQLFNVLKGEMSLIGPRPLIVAYLSLYDETQAIRHNVKPGITGWAQINGRNAISWEQKFSFDVFYVENQCVCLDIKILFLTLKKVISKSDINSSEMITMEPFKGTWRSCPDNSIKFK